MNLTNLANSMENNSTLNPIQFGPDVIIVCIFLVLTALCTVGGNILVIMAVGLVKKLRTPSNFLIVSLAVSDLLVGLLVMPLATTAEITKTWTMGEAMCDLFIAFDVLMCTASILNLCAISVDRYLAITRPLQYAAKRAPKRMMFMIAVVWIMSALISIPPMFGFKETFVPGSCEYSSNIIYQIYATCGAFYIPLIVMIVLYGRIFILARRMAHADAMQKRVTESIIQTPSLQYSNPMPQDRRTSSVESGKQDSLLQHGDKCSMDRANHLNSIRRASTQNEKYPLPPSELCRRRKPRPLHSISYEQIRPITVVQSPPDDSRLSDNSSMISSVEQFEQRIQALRKLRAEFFATPYTRVPTSINLSRRFQSMRQTTDNSFKLDSLLPDSTKSPDDSNSSLRQPGSRLHQSQSMRQELTSEVLKFPSRSSVANPPLLSISRCFDEVQSPSEESETHTAFTAVENDQDRPQSPRFHRISQPFHELNSNKVTLRPRQRPLQSPRRSLTGSTDYSRSNHKERSSLLGLPSNPTTRRLSTPAPGARHQWSTGIEIGKDLQKSSSHSFYRSSEHDTLAGIGNQRSRNASWASIKVPLKKRRSRGHSDSKAIKTLGVIMGCFCLCWIPFFIIALARPMYKVVTGQMLHVPDGINSLFLWLGYINSTINPIIYVIFNRDFRIPFREILLCRCRRINARLRSQRYALEYGLAASTASGMNQSNPWLDNGQSVVSTNQTKRRSNHFTGNQRGTIDLTNNHIGVTSGSSLYMNNLSLPPGRNPRRPSSFVSFNR